MHLFGLTGGIASGKSAVAARLRQRQVPVIDADVLARDAVAPETGALAEIAEALGPDVLAPDGSLDRRRVAEIVFTDRTKLQRLNAIVHPRVAELTRRRAGALADAGHPLACYEAALIVENGLADAFRPLVVVAAPEALQVARVASRDGATADEARARIQAQVPLAAKVKVADFVIENTGSLDDLARATDDVLRQICARLGLDEARYPDANGPGLG